MYDCVDFRLISGWFLSITDVPSNGGMQVCTYVWYCTYIHSLDVHALCCFGGQLWKCYPCWCWWFTDNGTERWESRRTRNIVVNIEWTYMLIAAVCFPLVFTFLHCLVKSIMVVSHFRNSPLLLIHHIHFFVVTEELWPVAPPHLTSTSANQRRSCYIHFWNFEQKIIHHMMGDCCAWGFPVLFLVSCGIWVLHIFHFTKNSVKWKMFPTYIILADSAA